MVRITRGDLFAIRGGNERYYYALILDKIGLFGGNGSFAFHRTSPQMLASKELLLPNESGFHAFIDFIFAKREDRLDGELQACLLQELEARY